MDLNGKEKIMRTIEINQEMLNNIVVSEIRNTWETLKQDLGAKNDVFIWGDPEADDEAIRAHLDAFELILMWYSTPEQLAEMGLVDD